MIKLTMLATLFAGILMGTSTVSTGSNPLTPNYKEERDTELIVEVDRSLESLTSDGIKNVQKTVYWQIKNAITSNAKMIDYFHVLTNSFVIKVNSKYVSAIRSLPYVKSVTENKLHFVTQSVSEPLADVDPDYERNKDYGGSENISATTMNKPGDTNDGEGTVIAILDNEFYFRAPHDGEEAWKHETFTDLDPETTNLKFKARPVITGLFPYTEVDSDTQKPKRAGKIDAAVMGEEGSLYFNNKVPFYFDYGGERDGRAGDYEPDFDVSSDASYHGSHVASIAAGNADRYKGIAPKAQLVCMKVFTNYKKQDIDDALGTGSSSGAYDVPILHALEDCITLGVDGINMSLGSNLDDFDTDSITHRVLESLAEVGILSAISAGNNGKSSFSFAGAYGNWTTDMVETGILGSYANSTPSTIVASGQPTKKFYEHAFQIGSGASASFIEFEDQIVNRENYGDDYENEHKMEDLVPGSSKTVNWQFVPNFGADSDYSKMPAGATVDGKIAVVKRGSIDFATKYQNAKARGAIGLIIINNDPTASSFNFRCSFGDVQPEIPVALVLYRDLKYFEQNNKGTFDIIKDQTGVNAKEYTVSDFSTDGARFDLELLPDITTPGENIRGAVPPQSETDKKYRKFNSYEFLSGTSMAAPNYAGVQAVMTSKVAKDIYAAEKPKVTDVAKITEYRQTVDLRLMSTARIMKNYTDASVVYDPTDPNQDIEEQPGVVAYTSPRMQGAGMVDLGKAYNTKQYLEAANLKKAGLGKAKISLKGITSDNLRFTFNINNEDTLNDKTYNMKLVVMRPAIVESNKLVARDYNDRGEVDSIDLFPGHDYYSVVVTGLDEHDEEIIEVVKKTSQGEVHDRDVYSVTRQIEYYSTPEACLDDYQREKAGQEKDPNNTTVIKVGHYSYNESEARWETYSRYKYSSVKDYVIEEKDLGQITAEKALSDRAPKITFVDKTYTLPAAEKEKILESFEYGTYLEGYIILTNTNDDEDQLNMPWMGFYTGNSKVTYKNAPVVEPFGFEKLGENLSTVYPSELVNDITHSLLGKTNADFGSTWVNTYVEPGKEFNLDPILYNDESLLHLTETNGDNYHLAGTDINGNYYEDAKNNIYVGGETHTNTMIIQQFVLRSVKDNYFVIKNSQGKTVYRDVLQDPLYGSSMGYWNLYKSHVDDNLLGGGYVSHRAMAVIPLYDTTTGEMLPSDDYTITFNYELMGSLDSKGNRNVISNTYSFHIDSDAPSVKKVSVDGDKVKIYVDEPNLAAAKVGKNVVAFPGDEHPEKYVAQYKLDSQGNEYIEMTKLQVVLALNENLNENYIGRLYIELTDKACERMGVIIKFDKVKKGDISPYVNELQAQLAKIEDQQSAEANALRENIETIQAGRFVPDFNTYTFAEHIEFRLNNDFVEKDGNVTFYEVLNGGQLSEITVDARVRVVRSSDITPPASSKGCGGNVSTTSITLAALAGTLAFVLILSKKRKLGGK